MSVRKRPWTNAKGETKETWVVDYKDGQGVRRLKTFRLKKEADAFSSNAAVEVRDGIHVADGASITVAAAADLWIATAEANDLEPTTIEQYRQHADLHIKPLIGEKLLSRLTVPEIREFEDELRRTGRSPAMVPKVRGSLGSILADAQERGLAVRNPVREMSNRRKPGKERRQAKRKKGRLKIGVDIPTPTEIRAFVPTLRGRWRPLLLTAVFAGLRASELRGLRWSDIDLEKREIRVHQRADRFNTIGRPKSVAGERSVPIPNILVNSLREWRLVCPRLVTAETGADGEPVKVLEYAFPNGTGKVESHANIINRGLIPAWIDAGVTSQAMGEDGRPLVDKEGSL